MILGYDMFRNITTGLRIKSETQRAKYREYLVDPGMSLASCRPQRSAVRHVAVCV